MLHAGYDAFFTTTFGNSTGLQLGDTAHANSIDVAEVIQYPALLSAGNRTTTLNYLGARYGLF